MIKIFASVRNPQRHGQLSQAGNAGDLFGYLIADHFLTLPHVRLGINDRAQIDNKTFCFVGSILQWLPKERKMTVYGPGFISNDSNTSGLKGNNIIGVRGHLSRDLCIKSGFSPKVVSDPGLLLQSMHIPEIFKKYDIGFIIHSIDRDIFFKKYPQFRLHLINNYSSPLDFFHTLSSYKYVITSSLHGAVFAHALRIPCAVIEVSGKIMGGNFKFKDYFSSLDLDFSVINYLNLPSHLDELRDLIISFPQPEDNKIRGTIEKMEIDIAEILLPHQ